MTDVYDEFSDLLGVYVLDAVEPEERERLERHLLGCPRCRAEVNEHREVAAFISQSGTSAPEGVWDKIASELSPPAPPLRMTISPRVGDAGGDVASIADAPGAHGRPRSRTMLAMLATAACIVAVLVFVTVGQSNRLNRLESAMDQPTVEALANGVVADSKVQVRLTGEAGNAEAVVSDSGQGFLIMNGFPPPGEGEVYQLWGQVDGTVLSLGTFGSDISVVPFSVDPARVDGIELFAVTQEKAPGVPTSTNDPVIAGTV